MTFRCFVEECDNIKNPIYDDSWVQHAVPGNTKNELFVPDQCQKLVTFNQSTEHNESCPIHIFSHETIRCNQWVFDNHEYTIVENYNLTCVENNWKLALVGTMHFAGIIFGSAMFGFFADKFGRKLIFIIAIIFMSITGIGQAVSKDYVTFLVFAFLNAVGTSGVFPLAFIMGVEMVGRSKREMAGVILNFFYAFGEAFVGIIAWLDGNWTTLQYSVSAPSIIFIVYYW